LFTVLAVGIGFSAVNVFGGFTEYIFSSLQESFIYIEANGHLTIFKEGFRTKGKIDPVRYLITKNEIQSLTKALSEYPEVLLVTPQLHISGLVSNGEVSFPGLSVMARFLPFLWGSDEFPLIHD
jgi:putative ABC transport system permease protein